MNLAFSLIRGGKMCSICNISNFELFQDGTIRNLLGISAGVNLFLVTKNKKDFFLTASDGKSETYYMTYVCPTCGKRLGRLIK